MMYFNKAPIQSTSSWGQHPHFVMTGVALTLSALLLSDVKAATINVGQTCSLMSAIESANTDLAVGGCSAGSLDDVITLPNQTITLNTVNNTDGVIGANGLPVINSVISIQGNGTIIERDNAMATPAFRLFSVYGNSAHLTLDDVTIRQGLTTDKGAGMHIRSGATVVLSNTTVTGNQALDGGGIYVEDSTLTLTSSSISHNSADNRGAGMHIYHPATVEINNSQVSNNSAGRMPAIFIEGNTADVSTTDVTISESQITNNTVTSINNGKGTIYAYYATLSIDSSTLSGNTTTQSGAALNAYQSAIEVAESHIVNNSAAINGGGIYAYYGTIEIADSVIMGNTASLSGGGIDVEEVNLTIKDSTVSANSAVNQGGGMSVSYGSVSLVRSGIMSNNSDLGGGAWFNLSNATISQSLISENNATTGGGLHNEAPTSIINSTFSGNSAVTSGGALYAPSNSLIVLNSTLFDNQASTTGGLYVTGSTMLTVNNTVVANNTGGDCSMLLIGPASSNWFGDVSCNSVAQGDPKLGPLKNNGGLTDTHAPMSGSGLIGQGDLTVCNTLPVKSEDQQGAQRGVAKCDIGAVEYIVEDIFFVIPFSNGKVVVITL